MSPPRTRALSLLVLTLLVGSVVCSVPGVAAAVAGAAPAPTEPSPAPAGSVWTADDDPPAPSSVATPGGDPTTLPSRHEPQIRERQTFARGEARGTVRLELAYEIPTGVTDLRVRLPDLSGSSISVVDSEGFDRQSETAFEWTRSTSTPTLALELDVSTDEISTEEWGVERDGWAFATVPPTGLDVTYTGTRPRLTSETRVEETGYATDRMAFMGPYDTVEASEPAETVRFVVGNGTTEGNVSAARAFLERAQGRFDFGVRRDRLVVFVLPYEGRVETEEATVTGEAFGDAFWVTADATHVSGAENAFAHEYVHSRLESVGNGSAAWLTEATAEYYGSLAVVNVGGTSYEAFYRSVRADSFAPNRTAVVLSEPESWRGTLADYEKGAHVLAALDAEIRARTDATLYDVFVANESFDDYAAFRAAVVETTGDETLGPWLDRYVTTEALPPLPDDPARYVQGDDLDPDGDSLTSEEEVRATPATNPFVADTDGDTLSDAREREARTDPTRADTDGDGTNDALDAYPTDPAVQRTTSEETETRTPTPSATAEERETATSTEETRARVTGTRTETPGFGVGAALWGIGLGVAAGALRGMRCRRENRASS
jgi:hypothetical protein